MIINLVKKSVLSCLLAVTGLTASASVWYPSPNGGAPVAVGQTLIASGGDVTVTFLGPTGAAYDEHLFVATPSIASGPAAGGAHFFDNHSTANGTVVDLGTFAAGTEIVFGLYVDSTGDTFYDGPASRNFDGFVHAYMVNDYLGMADTTYVGFEDLNGLTGSDWNYIDQVYSFTGAVGSSSVPDTASTMALLGLGLVSLGALASRRQQK